MANLTLPVKYAQAFLNLVKSKAALGTAKEELTQIKLALQTNKKLAGIFYHPGINREEKKNILKEIYKNTVSQRTLNLLQLLIDKKREMIFNDFVNVFSDMVDVKMGIKKVTIATAFKMADKEKETLISKLEKAMHTKLQVKTEIDSDMLGGIIIKDRFTQLDGSIRQFLKALRQDLYAAKPIAKKQVKKNKKK
ncbi:MAG: ATP synthase F1 subunit delta [bacterium]